MKWVTVTHSHRWHAAHNTVGIGHLYQGRYKSFPVHGKKSTGPNPVRLGICSLLISYRVHGHWV
jgi:hypothetical protein